LRELISSRRAAFFACFWFDVLHLFTLGLYQRCLKKQLLCNIILNTEPGGRRMKYIVAVNASPRIHWNTARLIEAAARGAQEAGAATEIIHLYRLDPFKGCISCFGCKLPESFGKCVVKDGLTDVLDKIRRADGLIIGSPNYLSEMTAGFRALYERLVFQSLTYNKERPNCNVHMIPVLLIHTSNCDESYYDNAAVKPQFLIFLLILTHMMDKYIYS